MCDHAHFKDLESRVGKLEDNALVHHTMVDEQIKTLFKSVNLLYRVTLVGGLILLLAVVYGALGDHGFNAVTRTAPSYSGKLTN